MSGFAEYRRTQKALEQNLTIDGNSVWEKANEKFIKKNWKDALIIRSELKAAAEIENIDLSKEIESDSNYADENRDINDYYTNRKQRLAKER